MRSTPERTSIHLVAMVNPPASQYAENWRHPLSRQDWLDARFYRDLGRTLERGCFDMLFLTDTLAIPEDQNGSYDTRVAVPTESPRPSLICGRPGSPMPSTSMRLPGCLPTRARSPESPAIRLRSAAAHHAAAQPTGAARSHAGRIVAARH